MDLSKTLHFFKPFEICKVGIMQLPPHRLLGGLTQYLALRIIYPYNPLPRAACLKMQGRGRARPPSPLLLPEFTGPGVSDESGPLGSTAWGVSGFPTQKLPCNHGSERLLVKKLLSPSCSGQLMAVEQAPGEGAVGRRILAEESLFHIQEPQCRELLMCLL